MRQTVRESRHGELGLDQRMAELERMAGPDAYDYDSRQLPLDDDLTGERHRMVSLSLEDAIRMTVSNNLEVQFARLEPAVREARVTQAEAAFDWVFFSNLEYSDSTQPQPQRQTADGVTLGQRVIEQRSVTSTTGLRRPLETGGSFQIQQELQWSEDRSDEFNVVPNPARQVGLSLQLDQPLLRGFGSETALSEIRIARNAERAAVAELKRDLIRAVTDAESAYWELVRAHRDMLILKRLLERGETVLRQVAERRLIDATPAQIASARARVEERRANVIEARRALRRASNRLKLLINDPELTIASEVLLVPLEEAIDEPVEYSLLDSIVTALEHRPEVTQAILSIDDTSIRQTVARNARLPQLDLRLQTRFSGLDERFGGAYEDVVGVEFVDYLVGLFFEQPIGGRRAEAEFRERRLQRMQSVIAFQDTVRQIIAELKNSLDDVVTNYRLIEQRRVARIAASEVLRALLVEKDLIRGLTVERLDLELSRQEALAQAERSEIDALIEYNSSIARLHAAMGTALERNRIDFAVPDVGDVEADEVRAYERRRRQGDD